MLKHLLKQHITDLFSLRVISTYILFCAAYFNNSLWKAGCFIFPSSFIFNLKHSQPSLLQTFLIMNAKKHNRDLEVALWQAPTGNSCVPKASVRRAGKIT
jgi:hypothetical protein